MKRLLIAIGLIAFPALASAQQAETVEYYGSDLIGSIRIVFDAGGNVIARQDYAPFGTPVLNGTSMPSEGFGGNEKDDETQQAYFHARSLLERTGRFSSSDDVYDAALDPQRWNRYAYAVNRPLNTTDPDGRDPNGPGNCWGDCNPEDPPPPWAAYPPSGPGDGCGGLPSGQSRVAGCQTQDPPGGGNLPAPIPGLPNPPGTPVPPPTPPPPPPPPPRPECDPQFIANASSAWQRSGDGTFGTEGAFWIWDLNGQTRYLPAPNTNERMAMTGLKEPPNAIALFHTHPNGSGPKPSTQDQTTGDNNNLTMYVGSTGGLWVYNPGSTPYQLRPNLTWTSQCGK